MDNWERFNETLLPNKKEEYYSQLNMKAYYMPEFAKDFEIKKIRRAS